MTNGRIFTMVTPESTTTGTLHILDLALSDLQDDSRSPPTELSFCSDSSDVSSVSSNESVMRSIFTSYWEKNSGAPALQQVSLEEFSANEEEEDAASCSTWHECGTETKEVSTTSPQGARRSIFPDVNYATSSLPKLFDQSTMLQRRANLSKARFCPLSSCLRSSSSCSSSSCKSDSPSVSFSKVIDVVEFETPQEIFAQEGWSNYFH